MPKIKTNNPLFLIRISLFTVELDIGFGFASIVVITPSEKSGGH